VKKFFDQEKTTKEMGLLLSSILENEIPTTCPEFVRALCGIIQLYDNDFGLKETDPSRYRVYNDCFRSDFESMLENWLSKIKNKELDNWNG